MPQLPATHPTQTKKELVIIHVCDEPRQINKDFACDRSLLLSEMKYFQGYLGGETTDIDISVHCDVHIFEWLVQWIHSPLRPPPVDASSVVSILISSEFLEMERLVEHCLKFMAGHLVEILRMPIDLACLSEKVVLRLAELCDADALSVLEDRKEKLLPKLYKRRLEIDFRHRAESSTQQRKESSSSSSKIQKCRYCGKLYPSWAQDKLPCSMAPTKVDERGRLSRRHAPQTGKWSLTDHVAALHSTDGMSWEQIYWLMWGVTHVFQCQRCNEWFAAADVGRCSYHDTAPVFRDDENKGIYPCCQKACPRFSADGPVPGCKFRDHLIDDVNEANRHHDDTKEWLALKLLHRRSKFLVAAAATRSSSAVVVPTKKKKKKPSSNDDDDDPGSSQEASSHESQQKETQKNEETTTAATKRGSKGAKPTPNVVNRSASTSFRAKKVVKDEKRRRPPTSLGKKPPAPQPEEDHADFAVFQGDASPRSALRESKADVQARQDALAHLDPHRRRAWELDCAWREADVIRIRYLTQLLRSRRKPWTSSSGSPHHVPTPVANPLPGDADLWHLKKSSQKERTCLFYRCAYLLHRRSRL